MILGLNIVDMIVIVLAIVVGFTGWTNGFVVGVLSFVGFVGGAILGLVLVPKVLGGLDPGVGVSILAVLLVLAIASIGQGILAWAGGRIRAMVSSHPARKIDAASGAVIGIAGLLVAAWAIGLAISSAAIPQVSSAVRDSRILQLVDDVVPISSQALHDAFQDVVASGGIPDVVQPWIQEPITDTKPPDGTFWRDPEVRAAAERVVKISGHASCDRVITGSGFVIARDRVMTNAHVVAGVSEPVISIPDADPKAAEVVLYDPDSDVAVLAVPDLGLKPLAFTSEAPQRGASAAAVGYPNGGPLRAEPVRVRGSHDLLGSDIYDDHQVTRNVLSLRGDIQPGNSGGPLVDGEGNVSGVIFAASLTDPDTGYALSRREVQPLLDEAAGANEPVSTGGCA